MIIPILSTVIGVLVIIWYISVYNYTKRSAESNERQEKLLQAILDSKTKSDIS